VGESAGACSANALAQLAGVSKGLLYHYFQSKRGFYVATIRQLGDELLEATRLDTEEELDEALRRVLQAFYAFLADNGRLFRTLVRGGIGNDAEVEAIVDDVRTRDPLAMYRLIILMTGISRPKAVVTDSKMNRIVLERGDPIGSEGGRVRAILQYKVLIGMPGKADPVEMSIEPPLASLVNEGAPATERKDL